ncbi:hypothetical protein ACFQLX_19080 [Streptomyces polyrhachis]|uniref:Uncharacterized protein n=1 Tax=Streptomyces polyrhachis TaxID=1282885 RepID=A0ABW2GHX3_9ACTN
MAKNRPRSVTLAEIVASLPPAPEPSVEGVLSPAGRKEFVDDTGRRWLRVRGPLDPRVARRLVARADALIVGEVGGGRLRHVPPADRETTWHRVKERPTGDSVPGYAPYEFVSEDGMTLLYFEEGC